VTAKAVHSADPELLGGSLRRLQATTSTSDGSAFRRQAPPQRERPLLPLGARRTRTYRWASHGGGT